jgi:hypothetical protein
MLTEVVVSYFKVCNLEQLINTTENHYGWLISGWNSCRQLRNASPGAVKFSTSLFLLLQKPLLVDVFIFFFLFGGVGLNPH